jgi:hypothetical protein
MVDGSTKENSTAVVLLSEEPVAFLLEPPHKSERRQATRQRPHLS